MSSIGRLLSRSQSNTLKVVSSWSQMTSSNPQGQKRNPTKTKTHPKYRKMTPPRHSSQICDIPRFRSQQRMRTGSLSTQRHIPHCQFAGTTTFPSSDTLINSAASAADVAIAIWVIFVDKQSRRCKSTAEPVSVQARSRSAGLAMLCG